MSVCTRILGPETSCDDPVARAFAGERNVELLNQEMVRGVYEASQGRFRIGRQSQLELAAIMRSVYLNEARYLPGNVADQVMRLNRSVLSYAVPQIVSEARMHEHYLEDRRQDNRTPVPHSVMTKPIGERNEVSARERPYFAPNSNH